MIKNSVIEAVPVATAPGIQQYIGLGIVLKVGLLKELLNYAARYFSAKRSKKDL